MTGKTHIALGFLTSLIIIKYTNLDSYTVITSVSLGSLLPDLDTQKSTLSKMVLPVSKFVDAVTKHRGATHTILPFLLMLLGYGFNINCIVLMGIGAFTHTFLDWLPIKCDSKLETITYYLLWIAILCITVSFLLPEGHTFTF